MTRFADLPRFAALCILAGMLGVMVWGLCIADSLQDWSFGKNQGANDLEYYRSAVDQIHQGRNYYDAAEEGLTRYGYQTTSTFNWRLPTCLTVIGSSPAPDLFLWLLRLLALLAVIAAVWTLLRPVCGNVGQLLGTLLLLGGAFSWSLYEHDAFLATEPWCEVFILFSLCAYARGWWPAGMAAALAALALRELVVPYCLVAAALAVWRGRRVEWLLWIGFLGLFAFLYYLHGQAIARRHPGLEGHHVDYWMHPTGLRFILQSCVMNVFLRTLPTWLIAVYFPVAVIGLIGWPGEIGARLSLSASIYIVAFSFLEAGTYWGYLYTAVLVLGAVRAPAALRDLGKAAFGRRGGFPLESVPSGANNGT